MPAAFVTEVARAKINLALHVTGRRDDGYHLLDSVVTFCEAGDRLQTTDAAEDSLTVSGRFAAGLGAPADNLVMKARDGLRRLLAAAGRAAPPVAIHLEKNLPIASGIGGGSADAAATLRGLMRLWGGEPDQRDIGRLALSLGADVPMCLANMPLAARGIGEDITPLARMPAMALVLANPMVGVSTPEIFRALDRRDNPPIAGLPSGEALSDWVGSLASLRNDLEPVASHLVPEIGELRALLDAEGALLSRMSGSGASCFGIFRDIADARTAADALSARRPDWYVCATSTISTTH